jgi:hypothetical protein
MALTIFQFFGFFEVYSRLLAFFSGMDSPFSMARVMA